MYAARNGGNQMVTMNDVSRHAGVSVATVSNVITGKRTVSEDKRRRVIDSIDALGYQVNLVARGLKTQRTSIIGLILPDITKLFFQNVIAGIIDAASQSGYRLNILSASGKRTSPLKCRPPGQEWQTWKTDRAGH